MKRCVVGSKEQNWHVKKVPTSQLPIIHVPIYLLEHLLLTVCHGFILLQRPPMSFIQSLHSSVSIFLT